MEHDTRHTKNIYRIVLGIAFCFLLFPIVTLAQNVEEKADRHEQPRTANYYLFTPIAQSDVEALSQWDILIVSPQTKDNSLSALRQMKANNPDMLLLVYIPSEEFPLTSYKQWESNPFGIWHRLRRGIKDDMWLLDSSGNHVTFWERNWMLDPTTRWGDYVSSFVADEFLTADSLYDGVFYDNVWTSIDWINNGDIDMNRDGRKDSVSSIRTNWERGMKDLFNKTRAKAEKEIILIGNGDRGYYDELNGIYFENFSTDINSRWAEKMAFYQQSARGHELPRTAIIGNNTANTGDYRDYRNVRFGLTSALLENGYYAFDFGDRGHENIWWYDEYNVDLGNPLGTSFSQNNYDSYQADVWRRDYANGISLVNSTNKTKTVDLGGEFEKIHGTQDPSVNDGSIISEVSIRAYDGLLLLKTFEGLEDVLFTNGEFARFFRPDGSRVRNGFFVFDEQYRGGDQIAYIDLDGNGRRDLLVVTGRKIMAWRDDGQLFARFFPYGGNYTGTLRVALGDLNDDGKIEIFVAPSGGHTLPIRVYSRDGVSQRPDWFPFGPGYDGGYTLAVQEIAGPQNNRLIIGTGEGHNPIVHVFTRLYEFQTAWLPYPAWMKGGVHVATGDLNGDGSDEIVTGPGEGYRPEIRVYRDNRNDVYLPFTAYTAFGEPGIDVRVADVDFDGKEDIIGLSSGF